MSLQPNHPLAIGKLIDPPFLDRGFGPTFGKLENMERHSDRQIPHTDMHLSAANFVFRHTLNKRWQRHSLTLPKATRLGDNARLAALSKINFAPVSTNGGAA